MMASTRLGRSSGACLAAVALLVVLAGDLAPGASAESIRLTVDNSARNGGVRLKITVESLPIPLEMYVSGGQGTQGLIEDVSVLPSPKFEFRLWGDAPPGAGVYSISPDEIGRTNSFQRLDIRIYGECEVSNGPGLAIRLRLHSKSKSYSFCVPRQSSATSKGPWNVVGNGIAG